MLLALVRFVARFPLPVLHATGALAGIGALALSAGFRRKLVGNLRRAGLYRPRLALAAAASAGRAVFEAPYLWFRSETHLLRQTRVEGLECLPQAGATGGVLFLTPHLGSFELLPRVVAASRPLTALFKPPKQQRLDVILRAARNRPNIALLPANATGVRGLLRALRRGEAVGVLPDQVPSDGDGTWAPFFGPQAYTMTLPERLARVGRCEVVMAVAIREPKGSGWTVRFERLDGDLSPAGINRAMEKVIQRCPEQYLWAYNRYKLPPHSVAAPGSESS